ncbi:MAG TPA: flagellar assembly peptidoglycan hydrolase FlgJ [Oleiagrimonas sp.]|nr:flagellar assembly peptidoglycan hydrolase FlgJ [Oleiagrimonas sp.]
MSGFDSLRQAARRNPQSQLHDVAQKFEALFVARMLQSMRKAGFHGGMTDNRQVQLYQSLLDRQLAQNTAGDSIGLAQMLIRQLSSGGTSTSNNVPAPGVTGTRFAREPLVSLSARVAARSAPASGLKTPVPAQADTSQSDADGTFVHFVKQFAHAAYTAAKVSGVSPLLILAQAALETGWGRHDIAAQGGRDSHNLFGIKAGSDWQGRTTTVATHEYRNGDMIRVDASFRAYGSYADAFVDHAKLMQSSRYASVRRAATPQQQARALQASGYATDPNYADKLIAIMRQIKQAAGF